VYAAHAGDFLVRVLMADKVERRRGFIENPALEVKNLDVSALLSHSLCRQG
jgi:hypothetical protein